MSSNESSKIEHTMDERKIQRRKDRLEATAFCSELFRLLGWEQIAKKEFHQCYQEARAGK